MDNELTYDEFVFLAERVVGVEPELWPELFPMVRDLKRLAAQLNALAPELHQEISLGGPASGAATEEG